ncbi:MAG: hypothetical protein JOY71_06720 [Acetobacteraceae bacterium]|nr:hypothetical protein [Acetobacteraceae bacterium]
MGADTFTVSGSYGSSSSGLLIAQSALLQEARNFCQQRGRQFDAVSDQVSRDPQSQKPVYTVRFRCLAETDPLLRHPMVNENPGLL